MLTHKFTVNQGNRMKAQTAGLRFFKLSWLQRIVLDR